MVVFIPLYTRFYTFQVVGNGISEPTVWNVTSVLITAQFDLMWIVLRSKLISYDSYWFPAVRGWSFTELEGFLFLDPGITWCFAVSY